ncbi:hypothetical protein OAJ55_02395 [Candidatus Nitrosopelagicus sp.]|nr:hypothetical protein [Candidatus Nitrosopelagicus sp.]
MVKHTRFSDKPDSDPLDENIEYKTTKEILSEEIPRDLKSYINSISKYIYIIAAAALLSGVFTPFTINAEIITVVYGTLTILLGLGGGILIYLGTKNTRFSSIMIIVGSGIMIVSAIIIYELANRSLFW